MNQSVEQVAEKLGITAGEVNALLSDEQRADNVDGETAIPSSVDADKAPASAVTEQEKADCLAIGKETAHEIEEARSASDAVAKTLLLTRATEFASRPAHAVFYLDGFAQGLAELKVKDSVVRARKSEAKAVIDAYARIVAEHLDEARDKLAAFSGSYHEFIALARDIRGKTTNKASGERATKTRLTETEKERALGLVKQMSPGQSAEVASLVGNHLLGMPDGEMAVVRMVANVYLTQLAMSKDNGVAKWAGDARNRALAILAAWDKQHGANTQDNTAHGTIPTPAESQQVAAQA